MLLFSDIDTPLTVQGKCHPMETKVTLTMKEQHKLKMVIDYEAGKIRAHRAAELLATYHRVDAVFFLR